MNRWNNMTEQVKEYLDARRRLGYELKISGKQLLSFAHFSDSQENSKILTIDLAVKWACKSESQLNRARRLTLIRGLAKYCILFEPKTQIPPPGLLGPTNRRLTPYIYTPQEISELMQKAAKLNDGEGLRPVTIQTLFGLLSSTGLRISEALNLNRKDVDLKNNLLMVKETKFKKSRYVPLHPTAVKALNNYTIFRDKLNISTIGSDAFFTIDNGSSLNYRQALYSFQIIRNQMTWRRKRLPRLHDLRHTFACNRLLAWYKDGVDVNNSILMLSVYLGHVKVTNTYWYLTGIPALMSIVAKRFEQFSGGESWKNR